MNDWGIGSINGATKMKEVATSTVTKILNNEMPRASATLQEYTNMLEQSANNFLERNGLSNLAWQQIASMLYASYQLGRLKGNE